jgi:hypothetical protein
MPRSSEGENIMTKHTVITDTTLREEPHPFADYHNQITITGSTRQAVEIAVARFEAEYPGHSHFTRFDKIEPCTHGFRAIGSRWAN